MEHIDSYVYDQYWQPDPRSKHRWDYPAYPEHVQYNPHVAFKSGDMIFTPPHQDGDCISELERIRDDNVVS